MTDERLCKCGHVLSTHDRDTPSGPMCGMCKCALFKAAPSTDEGEARDWVRAEESPDFVVWRLYEGGFCTGATTLPKEVEAAIRAPLEERIRLAQLDAENGRNALYGLTEQFNNERQAKRTAETKLEATEERIRELEAEVSSWSTQVETSEEEAERLREALRNVRESAESVETWLRPLLCDEDVTVCSHPICSAWIAAGLTASNLRALATSSTEGTDTAADEGGEE